MKYNNTLRYSEKTGLWYNKCGPGWVLKEHCKCCGEKYFTRVDKISEYCSYSCARKGCNNPMYGKTHTEEVRNKLRETIKNTTKKIKKKYGIDNISQLDSVKNKKGQVMLNHMVINY